MNWLVNFYEKLLGLFPDSFQIEFGEEMSFDFADAIEEASQRGFFALFVVLARELIELPVNVYLAHRKERQSMNIAQSISLRQVIRLAFGFGLTFAIDVFSSGFWFFTKPHWVTFLPFLHSFGWDGTYKDIQAVMQFLSSLVIGPALSGMFFIWFFSELRPSKRYLPILMLTFAIPVVPQLVMDWLIRANSMLANMIVGLGLLLYRGLMFGVLASMIVSQRKKTPWLLLAGIFGYFVTNLAIGLFVFSSFSGYDRNFLNGILQVTLINLLTGCGIGLLLGFVATWRRNNVSLTS